MSADRETFRTFCHISEYGEHGYANLHRLVASSAPLVLWAPSSVLLEGPGCLLTAQDFLTLVEDHKIRVIGRRPWITSKDFRNEHRWPGARWREDVDDALRSIAANDESVGFAERRVAIAEDEQGDRWALDFMGQNPEIAVQIRDALSGPDADLHFPQGVVETARRLSDDPEAVVRWIVRDAYNHDDAIRTAQSNTPFLLARRESRFHELIEAIRTSAESRRDTPDGGDRESLSPQQFAELTEEVLGVLRALDQGRQVRITKFMGSGGHEMLSRWMGGICALLAESGATDVRGAIYARLQEEFDAGELENSWHDVLLGHATLVGAAGTVAGVAEAIVSELTVLGSVGLASGVYSTAHGLAQKWGFAKVGFSGPRWPFLYAFGRAPSGRRHRRIGTALDSLRPSE